MQISPQIQGLDLHSQEIKEKDAVQKAPDSEARGIKAAFSDLLKKLLSSEEKAANKKTAGNDKNEEEKKDTLHSLTALLGKTEENTARILTDSEKSEKISLGTSKENADKGRLDKDSEKTEAALSLVKKSDQENSSKERGAVAELQDTETESIKKHSAASDADEQNDEAALLSDADKRTENRTALGTADQHLLNAAAQKESLAKASEKKNADKTNEASIGTAERSGRNGSVRDRRAERIEIQLQDQRSPVVSEQQKSGQDAGDAADFSENSEADLVIELRSNSDRSIQNQAKESRTTPSFQDALSRELRENANADIVKQASIVLKNGGEGLIRLSLRPESLGAVKIRLEMADNKVVGRIIVETEEALRAFEKEIESLEKAFTDGGFDGAGLELALSGEGSEGGNARYAWQGAVPFYSERDAAASYEGLLEDASQEESDFMSGRRTDGSVTINMLA